MRLTHYGHACVLIELPQRVLIDPGTYSSGFEELRDLDLILITHAHPDHLDVDRLRALLEHNQQAEVVHSQGVAEVLDGVKSRVALPGDKLTVAGVDIAVTGGGKHACIHSELPEMDNNCYLLNDALLHPGDSLDSREVTADVLLVPAGGPWMKIGEGVDYLRAVAPRVAIPIHQAGLAEAHQQMHHQLLTKLAPNETDVVVLEHAIPRTF